MPAGSARARGIHCDAVRDRPGKSRRLLVLPNGDVIVAEQRVGYLTLLRDQDGDGKADWVERHAEGFNGPYGLAWRDPDVLVADQDGIWRVPHRVGALRPAATSSSVPPTCRRSNASRRRAWWART